MRISNGRQSGISLSETIAVCVILLILAALLFPVFSRAKIHGQSVADVSNMHQIYLAICQYEQDYSGASPADLTQLDLYDTEPLVFVSKMDTERVPLADGHWPATALVPINALEAIHKISYGYLRTAFASESAFVPFRQYPDVGLLASPWLGRSIGPAPTGAISGGLTLESVCGPPLEGPILRIDNDGAFYELPKHSGLECNTNELFFRR